MITCDRCGRVSGHGRAGNSWICQDCRVHPENGEERKLPESPAQRRAEAGQAGQRPSPAGPLE